MILNPDLINDLNRPQRREPQPNNEDQGGGLEMFLIRCLVRFLIVFVIVIVTLLIGVYLITFPKDQEVGEYKTRHPFDIFSSPEAPWFLSKPSTGCPFFGLDDHDHRDVGTKFRIGDDGPCCEVVQVFFSERTYEAAIDELWPFQTAADMECMQHETQRLNEIGHYHY